MTSYGPPDDPSEAPTGYIDYDGATAQGDPQRGQPWYRRPIISLSVGLFVAILLGLVIYLLADQTNGSGTQKQIAIIIYGLSILARGNGGSAPITTRPSQTTTSLTTTPSLTPSATVPTTTESSPETTTEFPPPTTTAPWTQQHPHHHWWRSNLPPLPAIPHVPGFNP